MTMFNMMEYPACVQLVYEGCSLSHPIFFVQSPDFQILSSRKFSLYKKRPTYCSKIFKIICTLPPLPQSERHLDKITMVDEFLKRIFTVLHSNDPVARALTLRTLGAISVIIPERKQVLKSNHTN